MAKISESFPHDLFRFLHKPLRDGDRETFNFLERYLTGPQTVWEQEIHAKIFKLNELIDPALTNTTSSIERPRWLHQRTRQHNLWRVR